MVSLTVSMALFDRLIAVRTLTAEDLLAAVGRAKDTLDFDGDESPSARAASELLCDILKRIRAA